ncbi:E2F-associated phosphoprotein, putative [Plasmodium sp. gorilla clade G2]|uniref:E2F-associated phosphoprotein, putative n=1 Tax=Plasmodium sp. gorilla clade G2 TaxID=880535 RepID=UPI000D20BFAE|nr:E2F-associated phosphoprotein, putative [Plasmodium sp. gorilla clade G2]SOV10629.1 E2F-associated phosphoprotein, putative [Plasmodium sp. gorilla clade G2]
MSSKKVNNVINLLINEIKVKEKSENSNESASQKGIEIAKSFLNITCSDEKIINDNNECIKKERIKPNELKDKVNIEGDQINQNEQNHDDDDVINENEKAVLEFYDEKIDNYDEEYVNKKYRFGTKSCDSSLCCCGCFIPVCYQSQRHEYYVNQYRALYAINIRIDEDTIIDERQINSKRYEENDKDQENNENKQNKESDKSLKYHAVFCINCNNHIAYFEIQERVFHFFDVLPD